jgi:hypothetical protein
LFDLVADRPWERPPLARATFEAAVARQLDQQPHIPEDVQRLIAQMTAFDPADRPMSADVHEALEGAIRHASGEHLSRFARRHVPALVEARSKQNAGQPLPASAALGSLSGAPVSIVPTAPAGATPPEPSLALASNPRPVMTGALMLGVMLATSLALVSVIGIWNLFEKDRTGTPVTAEPEAAPAVAEPAAAPDVAPAIATEPVAPPEPPPPSGSAPPRAAASRPRDPASPVRIEPTTAPATVTPTSTTPAPAPVAAEPAPKPRPVAPTVVTWPVVVSSDPIGLDLWIDGEKVGSTPWSGQVTEGSHRVEVELDGVRSPTGTLAAGANLKNALRFYNKDQIWRTPQ